MTRSSRVVRVGTRGSALALEQTRRVVAALRAVDPTLQIETWTLATAGDRDKQTPLAVLGGQGIFAKEIETALLAGEIDLAVHSAKDLTSQLPDGLVLGAVSERSDPRDVLISLDGRLLSDLPPGARVGTSSRRRAAQLRQLRPDLESAELRGNVDTRLRKVREGQVDAGIMAAAGIERMGWSDRISEYLPADIFVPAPGQGALGIECRAGDDEILRLLARIDDPDASLAVATERAFLREIGGGCRSPIGAYATVERGRIRLRAMLADESMTHVLFAARAAAVADAPTMAAELAAEMLRALDARVAVNASPRPLEGLRVLVTRARGQASALSDRLRALGAEPVELATIEIAPPADLSPLDEALGALERYDWVIFTSTNGVDSVVARLAATGRDAAGLDETRLAAIGAATAARLADHGLRAEFVPEKFVAEEVLAGLLERGVAGARVLLPRAARARDVLPEGLKSAGARVDVVPAYRTLAAEPDLAVLRRIAAGEIDVVTLTSSSIARNLASMLGNRVAALDGALVACIGPITAETAREVGFRVGLVSDEYSIPGLIDALVASRERSPA